jgi:hypothetical protein
MVDYSEGYLKLKALNADLWDRILEQDIDAAKEVCIEISVTARLVYNQLSIQHDKQE